MIRVSFSPSQNRSIPLTPNSSEPFAARQTETPSASCGAEHQRFASNIVDPRYPPVLSAGLVRPGNSTPCGDKARACRSPPGENLQFPSLISKVELVYLSAAAAASSRTWHTSASSRCKPSRHLPNHEAPNQQSMTPRQHGTASSRVSPAPQRDMAKMIALAATTATPSTGVCST